jgi:flagellar protein FlaG
MPSGSGGSGAVAAQAPHAAVGQAVAQQPQQPTQVRLSNEIDKINAVLQRSNKDLELSISTDDATKHQVVKLTDKETGETLIQYPSEAVLAIAQGIDEFQRNFLLNQKA